MSNVLNRMDEFQALAEKWDNSERGMNIHLRIKNPAYQEILSWGKEAVPYMIDDFKNNRTRHWFGALYKLTNAKPVPEEDRGYITKMKEAWVKWFESQDK